MVQKPALKQICAHVVFGLIFLPTLVLEAVVLVGVACYILYVQDSSYQTACHNRS